MPGDSLGGVTVVNDLLLTSTYGGTLLAYDRATGAEVWRHHLGQAVNGSPAVVGDTIVWPVSGGPESYLLALRLDAEAPLPTAPVPTTPPPTSTPVEPTPGRPQPPRGAPSARPITGRPGYAG
jgi:hypothetical protein